MQLVIFLKMKPLRKIVRLDTNLVLILYLEMILNRFSNLQEVNFKGKQEKMRLKNS